MDRTEAKALQAEISAALEPIYKRHGLKIAGSRATFGTGLFNLTLKSVSTDPAVDPKVTDWAKYAGSFGLPVDALGKRITFKGQPVTITGLAVTRRKYPVVITYPTGKIMLTTVGAAKRALGLKVDPWEV